MVTRKPVAQNAQESTPRLDTATEGKAPPPYPATPTESRKETHGGDLAASSHLSEDTSASQTFDLIDMDEIHERERRDSDVSSHGTWDSEDSRLTLEDVEEEATEDATEPVTAPEVEIPSPLKIRQSQQHITAAPKPPQVDGPKEDIPAILRPGPAGGAPAQALAPAPAPAPPTIPPPVPKALQAGPPVEDIQSNPWQLESKNPYLRKASVPQDNSQKAWADDTASPPLRPIQPPPVIPSALQQPQMEPVELPTPSNDFANLTISKKPATAAPVLHETVESLGIPEHYPGLLPPVGQSQQPVAPAFPSTNPWRAAPTSAEGSSPAPPGPPPKAPFTPVESASRPVSIFSSPPWQGPEGAQNIPPSPISPPLEAKYDAPPGPPPRLIAGSLIDHEEQPLSELPSISVRQPDSRPVQQPSVDQDALEEQKRNEFYQIKHVNWTENGKLRRSPVLTQNANGPCPLLALVNALVLSTPHDLDTALVETLRTREQISLGLLLDAVFDELMSGRRGDTAVQLPDVGELYSFLLALHTGMNVNPRFVRPAGSPSGASKSEMFEETREMRLYSTFSVRLLHGWMPPPNTAIYAAFERNAHTFEDAQNIQFLEPELEDKQRAEGLVPGEQQTLQDIRAIKSFLETWPTQLTDNGLEYIAETLAPGQIAILFRNDHFSTLYKEPRHGALMSLVTDAGYSSHDEIVWESLVDVNGAASEMFSGDFRVVSHSEDARNHAGSSSAAQGSGYQNQGNFASEVPPPLPGPRPGFAAGGTQPSASSSEEAQRKAAEQEDHDLALALQLQEEEEDRQRQAEERRRREQELSEQFLSNEEQPPEMPPRRNQQSGTNGSRPAIPTSPRPDRTTSSRRPTRPATGGRPAVNRPADGEDPDAPPTYEQSASDRPYRPGQPTGQAGALNAYDALRRQSAYAQQSSMSVNTTASHNRRQSTGRPNRNSVSQPGSPTDYSPQGPYGGPRPINGATGAPTIRDAEERCTMM